MKLQIADKLVNIKKLVNALGNISDYNNPFCENGNERGIVICSGGDKYFRSTVIILKALRYMGCTLPVEWFYVEDEMNADMIAYVEKEFSDMVSVINVMDRVDQVFSVFSKIGLDYGGGDSFFKKPTVASLKSYAVKPFSLLASRFNEILLIDADNTPIKNPEFLFKSNAYQCYGNVFWADFGFEPETQKIYFPSGKKVFECLGIEDPRDCKMALCESGQLMINRYVHWKTLIINWYLNQEKDVFYKYFFGDKDLYWVAFCLNSVRDLYYQNPNRPFGVGDARMIGYSHGLGQRDLSTEGDIIFLHRTLSKWQIENPITTPCWDLVYSGKGLNHCSIKNKQVYPDWTCRVVVEPVNNITKFLNNLGIKFLNDIGGRKELYVDEEKYNGFIEKNKNKQKGVPYRFIGTRLNEPGYDDMIKRVTKIYDKKEEELVGSLTTTIHKFTDLLISGKIGFDKILNAMVKLLKMKKDSEAKYIFTQIVNKCPATPYHYYFGGKLNSNYGDQLMSLKIFKDGTEIIERSGNNRLRYEFWSYLGFLMVQLNKNIFIDGVEPKGLTKDKFMEFMDHFEKYGAFNRYYGINLMTTLSEYDKGFEYYSHGDAIAHIMSDLNFNVFGHNRKDIRHSRKIMEEKLDKLNCMSERDLLTYGLRKEHGYGKSGFSKHDYDGILRYPHFLANHFYLSYHDMNDADIFSKFCKLNRKLFPMINYTTPHYEELMDKTSGFNQDLKNGRRKIRVGFISSHLRNHSVGRDRIGVISGLPRDKFEVYVIIFKKNFKDQFVQVMLGSQVNIIDIGYLSLDEQQRTIAELKLDCLIHCDIGMVPDNYFLAYSRLAKYQFVTWGHSDTSGIDTIDYYISSKYFELPYGQAKDNYSEKLITLDSLSTYYYPIHYDFSKINDKDFKLPEGMRYYMALQSVFKFGFEFVDICNDILNRDSKACIVCLKPTHDYFVKNVKKYFFDKIVDLSRIHLIPHQSIHVNFIYYMKKADVVIDTYPFGGCNTSLEAFYYGVPVVTLPSNFIRGRFTKGFYEKMGVMDLVVTDKKQFVEKALKVAYDKDYRSQILSKIADNKDKLFLEQKSVDDYAEMLSKIAHDKKFNFNGSQ